MGDTGKRPDAAVGRKVRIAIRYTIKTAVRSGAGIGNDAMKELAHMISNFKASFQNRGCFLRPDTGHNLR